MPCAFTLARLKAGMEHRGEDGNDGDDHEQFDQREPGLTIRFIAMLEILKILMIAYASSIKSNFEVIPRAASKSRRKVGKLLPWGTWMSMAGSHPRVCDST